VTRSAQAAPLDVVDQFRRRLRAHFGARLRRLVLFGSYARGDAGPDSDVDVVVVLDRIDCHAERTWPMQLSGELDGPPLVPIVLSAPRCSAWASRRRPSAASRPCWASTW
jgi:predicted nucleotidyltransferase